MNKLRDELIQQLNKDTQPLFALVDEKNTILTDSALYLVFDVKSEAEEAQKIDYSNSKIVSIKFVAPESASDNAEFCYVVVNRHEHNRKLFIDNEEEFSCYTTKTVLAPEVSDNYLRDEVDANVVLQAYIEKM